MHGSTRVVDFIDDAVIADANAPLIVTARKLLAARRSRNGC
jgi:hypothetical protein